MEQPLREGRRGRQVRAFCERAAIQHRGYSLSLQRALTDFGADNSFLAATKKMEEHYGVELPITGARRHTLTHAKAIGAVKHQPGQPAAMVLTSMDGSMVRIVEPGQQDDKRKGKHLCFKQANLCCARAKDAADAVYGATMASVKMAGLVWQEVAQAAGWVETTFTHAVADGAEPIFNVFEEQFGTDKTKATFTLDFYHVSEYLGKAAEVMAPGQTKCWLHQQQGRLLENRVEQVLKILEPKLEPEEQKEAPVRGAHRYMKKRKENMDYAGAKAAGLPIGSGDVESGHSHIIQARLMIAGASWRLHNSEAMLQLRATRANNDWVRYWKELAKN